MSYSFQHPTGMLLALIPALINLGLLFYGIVRLPRNKTTMLFLFFVLALLLWQCNDVFMRISANEETARFWDKFFTIGVFAAAPLCLHFVAEYTGHRFLRSTPGLVLAYFPFVLFVAVYLSLPSPTLFIYDDFWGYINIPRPGSLEILSLILIPSVVVIAVIMLIRFAYRVWYNIEIKWQALLIAVGILIPTVQGGITQVGALLLGSERQIPITSTVMTFFSVSVIIAFSRYKLFALSENVGLDIMLKSLRDIVIIVDEKIHTKYLNPYAVEILGLDKNYGRSWNIWDLFPGQDAAYNAFKSGVIESSLQGSTVNNFETVFVLPGGKCIDVIVSAEAILNNNITQGTLLIARDITDRKKMLSSLRAENMVFELLSRGIPESEVLLHYYEAVQKENESSGIYTLFLTDEESQDWTLTSAPDLQKKYPDFFELLQNARYTQQIKTAFYEGTPLRADRFLGAQDTPEIAQFMNSENVHSIASYPVNSSFGSLLGVLTIFFKNNDAPLAADDESLKRVLYITSIVLERGSAFHSIENQQKTYIDLVNTVDGIVYEYDLEKGKYEFVSNRAEEVLGYPLDMWYNEPDFQMNHAHPEDKELLDDIMHNFNHESSMECEYRMMSAKGYPIWCRDYVRITYKNDKAVKLKGVIIDITAAKNIELEKELAAADLIKRNRDLEQFTYIVSHNLRAPLANIIGCTNTLDLIHDEADRKELMQGIADSANRLDAVVRDLNSILSIQKISAEKVEDILLTEVATEVVETLRSEWDPAFKVELHLEETPLLISVKPYIHSIFHNLISNSYKYRDSKKDPRLVVRSKKLKHMVEISFKDNGQGIDMVAHRQNVFGMYKRFHTDVEGKGMGLFMVKSQVEALNGTIEIISEVNVGTEFKILLPQ